MRSLLELEGRPFPTEPSAPTRLTRRGRWCIGLGAAVLVLAALGYLIHDEVLTRAQYDTSHMSLGVTQQRTHTVSAQLQEVARDLSVLKTQVGSDTTALNQDSAQLLGAQTSLSAAQAHVTQQASLIGSLQTCLIGVEQALNELAVGNQGSAIAALNAVSTSCTAAEASSG
jgi:tRNA(Leu) C34 or U34 (ribose-2'-O)-methylase TrmL